MTSSAPLSTSASAKWVALVDCDNFFVSCERTFAPALRHKPVVVLSSNDGCIVARSNEVKALGVPMGVPYFRYKKLLLRHRTHIFSSNFQLYADMSRRMKLTLRDFCEEVFPYSIDEAFIYFRTRTQTQAVEQLSALRQTLIQNLGLPASIGIAPSHTLAKIATAQAKNTSEPVRILIDEHSRHSVLSHWPVADVWGISRSSAAKLQRLGIHRALELAQANKEMIRHHLGIRGVRLIQELNGTFIERESASSQRRSFLSSRSFGTAVNSLDALERMLVDHVDSVCIKMLKNNLLAKELQVFYRSKNENGVRSSSFDVPLVEPTRKLAVIMAAARKQLARHYDPKLRYLKVGVCVSKLIQDRELNRSLLPDTEAPRSPNQSAVVEFIRDRMGNRAIFYGSQTPSSAPWQPRHDLRSACYTTDWDQLLTVGERH